MASLGPALRRACVGRIAAPVRPLPLAFLPTRCSTRFFSSDAATATLPPRSRPSSQTSTAAQEASTSEVTTSMKGIVNNTPDLVDPFTTGSSGSDIHADLYIGVPGSNAMSATPASKSPTGVDANLAQEVDLKRIVSLSLWRDGMTDSLVVLPTKSTLGRSIPVMRTTVSSSVSAVASAISALNRVCTSNAVSVTQKMQRFHERPGLKRKRLKMVRWKKSFNTRFASQVERLRYLKTRGW